MIYLYRMYSSVLRVWSLLFDKQAKREREDKSMNRIKELLKDKKVKVVAGVAAVIVLIAVGTTAVCVSGGNKNKQTAAQETQQQTTAVATAKKTEQTTATMEIAQAQTGAGETTAVAEETKVENESQTEEATAETPQQAEPVEEAQPEETPHGEEAVSENTGNNTGNDTEESNEPEEVEDTGNNEPEEAPAPEPTPEPATEAAPSPSLTDEERLIATGKWVFDSAWDTPRGHVNCYYYTDAITGYKIDVSFGDGKYSSCSTSGSEDLRAIFDAHGISLDGKKVNIDLMLML